MLFVVCGKGKGMCGFKRAAQMQICFKAFVHNYSSGRCKVASLLSCLETYFFYLVPTNRRFLLFILIMTL